MSVTLSRASGVLYRGPRQRNSLFVYATHRAKGAIRPSRSTSSTTAFGDERTACPIGQDAPDGTPTVSASPTSATSPAESRLRNRRRSRGGRGALRRFRLFRLEEIHRRARPMKSRRRTGWRAHNKVRAACRPVRGGPLFITTTSVGEGHRLDLIVRNIRTIVAFSISVQSAISTRVETRKAASMIGERFVE